MKCDRRAARQWLASVIPMLALILGVMGCASISSNVKTQPISTGGGLNSATPSILWTATATMTPLQPAAPPSSQKPILANVFIPAVVNLGIPDTIPTELPPIETTNDTSPTATPLTPTKVPFVRKTILVDISEQHVYAYEKGQIIFSFIASTGRNNSTQAGRYKILDKHPRAYSDPWGFWMPYWMGIYYVGSNLENGFHSLPVLSNGVQIWGKKIGRPITYGCVVLKPNDMKKLYRWAGIGTAVVIQK